jgi:hypothetical protein
MPDLADVCAYLCEADSCTLRLVMMEVDRIMTERERFEKQESAEARKHKSLSGSPVLPR